MKARIYVDEVGNPDLGSSDNPNHRFLSLTGVILDLDAVRTVVHPQLERIKNDHFQSHPDEPVILHRKDIINCRGPFRPLKDARLRAVFDSDLLRHLKDWHYTVITVCLDKKKHRETYTTWRYDPYHYCLEMLIERYVFFLRQNGLIGDVMAESRGGKEDRRLKDSFHRLWESGTHFVDKEKIQEVLTSARLKVTPKKLNVAGLQIADILAHPSRNEILHAEGLLVGEPAPFAKKIIEILQGKYYQRAGRTFGKKLQ